MSRTSSRRKRARRTRRSRAANKQTRRIRWARRSNEELLNLRICDLGVRLNGTWVEDCVESLYADLEARNIRFRPHIWLSYDWFSPDGIPGFAIPFYLAHPRLIRQERSQMLEVEGGSREECMKILRHECGHAIQHAFQLQRRRSWQKLFGKSSREYPDFYRPNPASQRYVQHLRLYYAQSHPDEDFAETFAVWLQPRAVWRKRYTDWPALKKLEYVDELMEELKGARSAVRTRMHVDPLLKIRKTLRAYYAEKRERYLLGNSDMYDRDLTRLFSSQAKHRDRELASKFLRRNRPEVRRLVSRWTGEYQFTLDQVLNDMIGRCRELKLRAVGAERQLRMDFAVLLTAKTIQSLHNRRNWIAL
ncbi:MAG: putative zinc-binding metallopeptidase [Nitrospirota bacterium]|nr:putative zinc-binding metallopeptidase [Nitrospirota bacterium]